MSKKLQQAIDRVPPEIWQGMVVLSDTVSTTFNIFKAFIEKGDHEKALLVLKSIIDNEQVWPSFLHTLAYNIGHILSTSDLVDWDLEGFAVAVKALYDYNQDNFKIIEQEGLIL